MRLVSFTFDDGFENSSIATAEIFESFGLRTCFNVIATGHVAGSKDPTHSPKMAGFDVWNDLQRRGHEVQPHGYHHANKAKLPLHEAQDLINRCMAIFDQQLVGFDRKKSVFAPPYGASTPQLNEWLFTQVRAVRVGDYKDGGINPLPTRETKLTTTVSAGPDCCDDAVLAGVERILALQTGWFIWGGHGLDGEGWGAMTGDCLKRVLERLTKLPDVKLLPVGEALDWGCNEPRP